MLFDINSVIYEQEILISSWVSSQLCMYIMLQSITVTLGRDRKVIKLNK